MSHKHTQRPWLVQGHTIYALSDPRRPSNVFQAQFSATGPDAVSPEELRANVLAASAAPDLLEACEAALAVLGRQGYGDGDLCRSLAAAIAKAKGGGP